MRPDEHRRRKNEAYRKKHNHPSQKTRKDSPEPKLDSNADRYGDEELSLHEPVGKDFRELLDIAANQGSAPGAEAEFEGEMSGLSIDTKAVADAADCFSLAQLLQLQDNELMKSEIHVLLGDASSKLSEYLDNHMDPVYVVDHKVKKVPSKADVVFLNTGRRTDVLPDIADGAQVATKSSSPAKPAPSADEDLNDGELEDWLDSILDD